MELQRAVTVAVNGVTKRFGPKDDLAGVPADVIGRMRRAGAFGDSAKALGFEEAPIVDFETMTVPQLKELAETKGLDLGEAKVKAEIIAVLTAAQE